MKKMMIALVVGSFIAGSSAFAGNISLGKGRIGSGINYPRSADLNLAALTTGALYDITCKVAAPNAKAYPVDVRFDIHNQFATPQHVLFDGNVLNSNQQQLTDNDTHIVSFPWVSKTAGSNSVVLTWLNSDSVGDPVNYECYADPVRGLLK